MKNPNPKQLDKHSVEFWFKEPEQIDVSIETLKEDLLKLHRSIRHDVNIIKNVKMSDLSLSERIEILREKREKTEEKKNALAQWIYIKWRYEQTTLEKVVFT